MRAGRRVLGAPDEDLGDLAAGGAGEIEQGHVGIVEGRRREAIPRQLRLEAGSFRRREHAGRQGQIAQDRGPHDRARAMVRGAALIAELVLFDEAIDRLLQQLGCRLG